MWGARVREPTHAADVLQRDHSRGSATLTRVSAARRDRAAMVLRRYQQVANAGFTHVAHLLVVDTALGRIRVRHYAELTRRGYPACMDAKLYQCLINGFPAAWWQVLDEASALLRSRLETHASPTLGDLVRLFPLPTGSWVRLPDGTVHQIGPDGIPAQGSSFEVTPTNRLTGSARRMPPGVTRDQMCEVFVWREVWTPHNEDDAAQEERRMQRGGRGRAHSDLVYVAAQSSCLAY